MLTLANPSPRRLSVLVPARDAAWRGCLSLAVLTGTLMAVAGSSPAAHAAAGDLDTSFNGTGKVTTTIASGGLGYGTAIQSNGKIVVAGDGWTGTQHAFALARYNRNGSLDTTFNSTGIVTTAIGTFRDAAAGVAIQPDGRIVAAGVMVTGAGNDYFALARYLGDCIFCDGLETGDVLPWSAGAP